MSPTSIEKEILFYEILSNDFSRSTAHDVNGQSQKCRRVNEAVFTIQTSIFGESNVILYLPHCLK